MKICLINNLYKPYSRGGAERVLELILQGLNDLGHEVNIITTCPIFISPKSNINDKIFYIPSTYHFWDKIPLILRPFFHFFNIFNIFTAYKVLKILKKNNIEIVITNNLLGLNLLFLNFFKKNNLKHLHILHDIQLLHPSGLMLYGNENILNTRLARVYQSITKRFIGNADKIISPSKWLLSEHINRGFFKNNKTEFVRNPVKIAPNKRLIEKTSSKSSFSLLYVGLLSEAKGVEVLLKAFEKIPIRGKIKLSLVGKNLIGNRLNSYLTKFNNIDYVGTLSHNEVIKKMLHSDILIMPSLCYENSPTVIYEAINIGLPVIASDIAGIPELVDMGKITLFRPGDSDALYRIMEKQIKYSENSFINSNTIFDTPKDYCKKILS
jgi:glycosyltransferase involved in cell wall biosynthesis